MKIEKSVPPPPVQRGTSRMTPELRAMCPGDSVVVDPKTAACLRMWGRNHVWEMTQRKDKGKLRVWRIK